MVEDIYIQVECKTCKKKNEFWHDVFCKVGQTITSRNRCENCDDINLTVTKITV